MYSVFIMFHIKLYYFVFTTYGLSIAVVCTNYDNIWNLIAPQYAWMKCINYFIDTVYWLMQYECWINHSVRENLKIFKVFIMYNVYNNNIILSILLYNCYIIIFIFDVNEYSVFNRSPFSKSTSCHCVVDFTLAFTFQLKLFSTAPFQSTVNSSFN